MKKLALSIVVGLALMAVVAYLHRERVTSQFFAPTESSIAETPLQAGEIALPEVVAEGLLIPWEVVFLPEGDMLVTERAGRLLRIGSSTEVTEVSGVAHQGEGGLLGLALHPDFASTRWLYLYLTTVNDGVVTNQVERYTLEGITLTDRVVILDAIPGARNHDGGRIAFGPDGMLYIATGDAGSPERSQDVTDLAGKILRVDENGHVPADNPFGSPVYSYGHRNVQGLAFASDSRLFATEHGRSGVQSGYDELNLITPGSNYGWPEIEGDERADGMVTPILHSGARDTWAPSGMVEFNQHLIFTGLRGQSLYVVDSRNAEADGLQKFLVGTYGRLRSVTLGPDGMLYVLTNNRDGRGDPEVSDDRIIRIDPRSLGL